MSASALDEDVELAEASAMASAARRLVASRAQSQRVASSPRDAQRLAPKCPCGHRLKLRVVKKAKVRNPSSVASRSF